MNLIIIALIISMVFIMFAIEKKRKCNHDWELVRQEIYYFQYHKTYKCSKCGKRKYIEEWGG